jgi:hypothetical protein
MQNHAMRFGWPQIGRAVWVSRCQQLLARARAHRVYVRAIHQSATQGKKAVGRW